MISGENLNYAIKNLWNRKLRSFLTILSIFVGISTIFIFVSYGLGLFNYINEISTEIGVDKLTVQARGLGAPGSDATFRLEESDVKALRRTRGVKEATGVAFGAGAIERDDKTLYTYIIGLPTDDKDEMALTLEYFTIDIFKGRLLEKGDDNRIALGYRFTIPDGVYEKPMELGDKLKVNGFDFTVAGFFEEIGNPNDDAMIYLTLDAYKKVREEEDVNFGFIVGRVDDVSRIDEIRDRAEKNIRKSRGLEEGKEDFYVQSVEQLIESFTGALNIVVGFIVLIAVISVLVSAINTANTMFTSILERTKEIGILKAIGARNSEVMYIFLLESSILGLIAGIIGLTVGYLLANLGAVVLDNLGWGFLAPFYPWWLVGGCILFATVVGTVSGLIPAFGASRQHPVDSLRYE